LFVPRVPTRGGHTASQMSSRINFLIKSSPFILAITSIVIYAYEYGPDPGYSGAPGDNATGCTSSGCHSGTPNSAGGSVKINAAGGTTYVPGQTQQIQVTITDSSERKYGFELSARVDSNPKVMGAGTFTSTDGNTQVFDCRSAVAAGAPPFPGSCPSGNTLQWIEHNITGYTRSAAPSTTYSFNWTPPATNVGTVTLYAGGNAGSGALQASLTHTYLASLKLSPATASNPPTIGAGGVVPVDSSVNTIQPGEWASIYGTNLASGNATWNGDFPASLGGTSVTVNNKSAYLWFVSPNQINFQVPDDPATGIVNVTVTTAAGTATSTATLAQASPAFLLLDATHVAGFIFRASGSNDILGPTGTSLGYRTVAAKAGDIVELYGLGFGPTNPVVPAGQLFFGAAPATNSVRVQVHGVTITPAFAGLSAAGLYQINLTIPPGLGTGDQPLIATVSGVQTQSTVVISLQ
jgi:uncharacterized protein (TIGR03437 family)